MRRRGRHRSLERIALFAGLSEAGLQRIARLAEEVTFSDGAIIANESDPRAQFIVILRGSATASVDGGSDRVLIAGDYCGELTVIGDVPFVETVRAITPVEALAFGRRQFWSMLDGNAVVASRIVAQLGRALRERVAMQDVESA